MSIHEDTIVLWIKTRVGLCALSNNFEIRTFKKQTERTWWLTAQSRSGVEIEKKHIFSMVRATGPWFHLAHFLEHDGVEAEIGRAMQVIADAVASSATSIDLSQLGSADAWTPSVWKQIQWP